MPRIDPNVFFRDATLRICGDLRIEQALWEMFTYVGRHIPAFETHLHYYDPRGITQTIARADRAGGQSLDRKTVYPEAAKAYINSGGIKDIYVAANTHAHPALKHVFRHKKNMAISTLAMRLSVGRDWVGGITFNARGRNRFEPAHMDLVALLKEPLAVALSNSRRYRELVRLKDRLSDESRFFQDELTSAAGREIVGSDFGLKGVMDLVEQVAPLKSPVLISGETGTGKELIARAIHSLSPRRGAPFVTVNCGAVAPSLMDSELFGHEKGAFTGAAARKYGRFERADRGTVFLDEIGELPLEIQVRLLRVLQEEEIERLGSQKPVKLDLRVIAATHQDLRQMVAQGRFREDLFFRLQVFPVTIPPLRERKEDIPALAHYFILRKSRDMGIPRPPALDKEAVDTLTAYHWPGNVREFEHTVERALILGRGKRLNFREILSPGAVAPKAFPDAQGLATLDQAMAGHIRTALALAKGKIEGKDGAARLLDINPGTLRHRMRKLNIPFGRNAR